MGEKNAVVGGGRDGGLVYVNGRGEGVEEGAVMARNMEMSENGGWQRGREEAGARRMWQDARDGQE